MDLGERLRFRRRSTILSALLAIHLRTDSSSSVGSRVVRHTTTRGAPGVVQGATRPCGTTEYKYTRASPRGSVGREERSQMSRAAWTRYSGGGREE